MSVTDAMIASAKAGALIGTAGGALPLAVGLYWGEHRKAVIGLSACVLAGAIGGTYAVIPASLMTVLAIIRARQEEQASQEKDGHVLCYNRAFACIAILGIPVLALTAFLCVAAAIYLLAQSDGTFGMKLKATFVGLLGVAFGWVIVVAARYWYVLFTEYTVTEEGVKIRYMASSEFARWESLIGAKYSRAFGQIELEFAGCARRVILSNADLDPQRRKVLMVLGFVERVAGRQVPKTFL